MICYYITIKAHKLHKTPCVEWRMKLSILILPFSLHFNINRMRNINEMCACLDMVAFTKWQNSISVSFIFVRWRCKRTAISPVNSNWNQSHTNKRERERERLKSFKCVRVYFFPCQYWFIIQFTCMLRVPTGARERETRNKHPDYVSKFNIFWWAVIFKAN